MQVAQQLVDTHVHWIMELCSDLGTLPQADGCVPTKEHVQEVLDIVTDLKAKPHPHHGMPGQTKLLVHCLFNHLGCSLEGRCVHVAGRTF